MTKRCNRRQICFRIRSNTGNRSKPMELVANWSPLVAVGCTLAIASFGAVAYLDANRRTQNVRKSSELEADVGRLTSERNALSEEIAQLKTDRDALGGIEERKNALESEIALLE